MQRTLIYLCTMLLGLTFAACKKDDLSTEGFVKVYNDFVIFGKTLKTADKGFLLITTDNVNDNKRFAIKVNSQGEKDWQTFLDYNSPNAESRTVVKNFVNITETPDGMALVLAEILDPVGVGMPPTLKFIKVNPDGNSVDSALVSNPFLNSGLNNISFSRLIVSNNGGPVVTLVGITTQDNLKGIGMVQFSLGANGNVASGAVPVANSLQHFFISGFTATTIATDLVQIKPTNDNGFIVLAPGNRTAHNGFIIKVNSNLQEQWRYYHRSGSEAKYLIDAAEMPGNQLMILGQAGYLDRGTNKNDDDFLVMIIDAANGDVLKEVRYRDIDNSGNSTIKADANVARAITPLSNGNFLLVGDQSDYAQNGAIDSHTEGTNLYLLEITANADAAPVRRVIIESSFGLHGNDILQLDNDRLLALCSKHSFGFMQYRDMVLMEIFADGNFVK